MRRPTEDDGLVETELGSQYTTRHHYHHYQKKRSESVVNNCLLLLGTNSVVVCLCVQALAKYFLLAEPFMRGPKRNGGTANAIWHVWMAPHV
jgi:hypothetical protein